MKKPQGEAQVFSIASRRVHPLIGSLTEDLLPQSASLQPEKESPVETAWHEHALSGRTQAMLAEARRDRRSSESFCRELRATDHVPYDRDTLREYLGRYEVRDA